MAAFNIGGITLHSALHLPVQKHNCNDLRGQVLVTLQHKLMDIKSWLWMKFLCWDKT